MKYQPFIGLEVHVELATNSKIFCGCPAEHFGVEPNTHTCPVCLGLPGALPVPNKKAIDWTLLLGLALDCQINQDSKFDRKNYFYPDLPKGYQITQYDEPFCVGGKLKIKTPTGEKTITIRRVHLEEDTGKLQHTEVDGQKVALVDFNRSGVPLVEIVTEPDFASVEEVDVFLKKLQRIIRYLGISNADMEKGSMRLEPSISIKPITNIQFPNPIPNDQLPKYRVELKNINSFRFARKAIEYEIKRQTELFEKGEKVPQQTRGWSETKNATVPQREKEEAHDYRYFPEPDIPPIHVDLQWQKSIEDQLPQLPDQAADTLIKQFGLSEYDADILAQDKNLVAYFKEALEVLKATKEGSAMGDRAAKTLSNWIINKKVAIDEVLPAQLIEILIAFQSNESIDQGKLAAVIEKVLADNAKAVQDFKSGKTAAFGFLIGQAVRLLPNVDKNLIARAIRAKL